MGLLLEVTFELDGRLTRSYQSHVKYESYYLELSGILALFRLLSLMVSLMVF